MVKLDILSDPICPWCLIGKTWLDRALEAHPDHPFAIEWHPFRLNPDMEPDGMDRREYLTRKFGGAEAAFKVYANIARTAEAAGLAIEWDRIARTPQTLDAHRLIHWAGIEGRQTPVVAGLFRAYFSEGRDIGDAATLAAIAGQAGLDAAMIAGLLAGAADRAEIAARDAHARARGVTGVPTFILANTHVLTGAQPQRVWDRVLDEIAGREDV
ncbi:MAG TPA: polyketide biosynthesis protein [Rhodobacteraceae bacterium]|jgi:predicted DsbA family dithiol-disulfide isomerase|nr:DsbA family oxidoreductase [Paracoccaceae bacterium]HBG99797.1 polyketide biosynthesis protein [Paracoccaceae bacterium]